ncbi:MAG: hypothetical protein ACRDIV_05775 [Ktedonobacteraceae bacterium]
MATTRMLALTRLRYDSALHGLAMFFGGVKLPMTIAGVICDRLIASGPVFATVGISVPISRGSPPFYDE